MSLGKCISEYNFTSTVKHVLLEQSLLHAITTTGLETYTLRTINAIHINNEMVKIKRILDVSSTHDVINYYLIDCEWYIFIFNRKLVLLSTNQFVCSV